MKIAVSALKHLKLNRSLPSFLRMRHPFRLGAVLAGCLLVFAALFPNESHAADLKASDGAENDQFGVSVSLSGSIGLVGAFGDDVDGDDDLVDSGSAYVFRNLGTATGTVTQNAKLTASGRAAGDELGASMSLSGSIGLVGASYGNGYYQGSVYVFRGLDTATGDVRESAQLVASDGAAYDRFGLSVSLSGNIGLIGGFGHDDVIKGTNIGSAYVFRNLDTATGTVTENAILRASDGAHGDIFGQSVSLSGSTGLVGANGKGTMRGSAYVFLGLDTATGEVTENAKLTASDGEVGDRFGYPVSLDGSIGLVGAFEDDSGTGSAYVFRDLDTATGTVMQNAKLTASDRAPGDSFCHAVSLSGSIGLVGADADGDYRGSAYIFRDLDTASGAVTENVKITASDGEAGDFFGCSVSLSGDSFLIGAYGKNTSKGKAYSGSVGSVTVLDTGNVSRTISGIDFVSREDWIIGKTTASNSVTLTAASTADVTTADKKVYIGKNAGSDNNTLTLDGTCTANEVQVGAEGNSGNALILGSTGAITADSVTVASGSSIGGDGTLEGDLTLDAGAKLKPGTSTGLKVTGEVVLDSSFGVDDILGLDGITTGNHTLISGSTTDFSALGLQNFGSALPIGGGRLAYLSALVQGVLLLTVVDPSAPPAPVIISAGTASGKVGTTLTYQITASNSPTSYAANALPAGLSYNTGTGKITGKPTKAGTFSSTVFASNLGGTVSKTVKFTIAKETTVPVLTVTTPATLKVTTTATAYTVKGKATDNISPVKVEYRIDPPTAAGYGAYKAIALSGTATSKTWSYKVATPSKGVWKVQFRALDAAGNISTVKAVTITRK